MTSVFGGGGASETTTSLPAGGVVGASTAAGGFPGGRSTYTVFVTQPTNGSAATDKANNFVFIAFSFTITSI